MQYGHIMKKYFNITNTFCAVSAGLSIAAISGYPFLLLPSLAIVSGVLVWQAIQEKNPKPLAWPDPVPTPKTQTKTPVA